MPRKLKSVRCEWCGTQFHSQRETTRFCSPKCQGRATFWSKIQKTDGCWLWTGCLEKDGMYGASTRRENGKRVGSQIVHKIVYEELVGPVPEGLVLDHLCRNKLCVRPEHLQPVTDVTNLSRGAADRRAIGFCGNGHVITPEGTRVRWVNGTKHTECRACVRDYAREYGKRVRLLKSSTVPDVAATG